MGDLGLEPPLAPLIPFVPLGLLYAIVLSCFWGLGGESAAGGMP